MAAISSAPQTLSAPGELRVAVQSAIARGELHPIADGAPRGDVVVPLRSYVPGPEAPKRSKGVRPMREKFSVAEEMSVARIHKAVKMCFEIERRMGSAGGGGSSAWPFPTLFDRNTDYAPGSVILRPARTTAPEVQFRDDVADLLVELAKHDGLQAKLVAGRAVGKEWEELRDLDPDRRGRWMLDKVRRRGLLFMAQRDAAEGLRIIARVILTEQA
jgi:hypothetical protein